VKTTPRSTTALVPVHSGRNLARLNKSLSRTVSSRTDHPVPHWGRAEIARLVEAALALGKGGKGERDALMIRTILDAALRVSEALGLRPCDLVRTPDGFLVRVIGKRGFREAASPSRTCSSP